MKKLVLLIIVLVFYSGLSAQETNKAGTSAAQFLKIGVSAKENSMAGATAALVNNESSMYWNPAGLVNIKRISVFASHTNWFADINHNFFGLIVPVGNDQTFGVSATILSMDEMEVTTEMEPQGTGEFFDASDACIGLSYSIQLVDFFSFGTTVKLVTQNIYNESASTIAVDLGTQLNTGFNGIKIGMAFTNFGGKLQLEGRDLEKTYDPNLNNSANNGVVSDLSTESWELPTNFRVGIGWDAINKYDAAMLSDIHKLRIAVDANHPNDAPENVAVGMEYEWQDLFAVRSGYHFNDDIRNWVVGFGLKWQIPNSLKLGVDYAYADFDQLNDVHTFTFSIGF